MTRTEAKKIINGLKNGVIYGVFNHADDQKAFWSMRCYDGAKIYINYYGCYTIPCKEDCLLDWLGWGQDQELYLKPAVWDWGEVAYVAS